MKITIAPDSFKGSLSAFQAAETIARGLKRIWPDAEYLLFPIADGGEGTVATLVRLTGGRIISEPALDPFLRPIEAEYGFLGDQQTAVVEMAAASGLTRLKVSELDPTKASTFGFGQQIRQALTKGAQRLIVGLGGSATNDGGSGMLSALGLKFLDKFGRELPPGGLPLKDLAKIEIGDFLPQLNSVPIIVASDVQNPLIGPSGATAVFGPQKGATAELIPRLDEALGHFASLAGQLTGRDVLYSPGAGAAGGLGAAFKLFTQGQFRPGVQVVLEEGNFPEKARESSFIVTGEGRSDGQTSWGKAPVGVAAFGQKLGIPTVCLSASLGDGYEKMYAKDIAAVMSMIPGPMTLDEAIKNATPLLEDSAERLGRLLKVSIR
jgi:glycerate kinase